jgi:DNA-binding NtrC family response regulator
MQRQFTLLNDRAAVRPAVNRVRVHVIDGPDRGLVYDPTGTSVAIGTSPDNEVVLKDPTISRYHLELRCEEGILVRDLGSRNGTFVNEVRIHEAIVPIGARVRIGGTVLSLLDAGRGSTPSPQPVPDVQGLVAASPVMQDIARAIDRLARSNVSVLVQGETGTGKELIARAIHEAGPRASGPFIVVDAGALAPTLIASHLFGHERGAFTGAERRQEGAFELAHGGSIFLDEIGELPLSIQPALLGVLERRSFRRVGGKEDVQVDVRVISATHRDLRAEANQGTFRADLYFRLAVARIHIPPLRERPEDVNALVEHFAREITGAPGSPFSDATMEALHSHRWSGNVRELRNVVESALAMGNLNLEGVSPAQLQDALRTDDVIPYRRARAEAISTFERRYLTHLIEATSGNASAAARTAGMDRPYLLSLLRKHGLR